MFLATSGMVKNGHATCDSKDKSFWYTKLNS